MLLRLVTKNDRYGNPQRGWLYIPPHGGPARFFDEGYHGIDAIPLDLKDAASTAMTLEITPKQYRALRDSAWK